MYVYHICTVHVHSLFYIIIIIICTCTCRFGVASVFNEEKLQAVSYENTCICTCTCTYVHVVTCTYYISFTSFILFLLSLSLSQFLSVSFDRWEFDAFELNYLTLEQPLVVCAYTVFTVSIRYTCTYTCTCIRCLFL